MSSPDSSSIPWKTVAIVASAAAFLLMAFAGGVYFLLSSMPPLIGREWTTPPLTSADVGRLSRGTTLTHSDTESRFMLVASAEMNTAALAPHGIFDGRDARDLVNSTSGQHGPWIVGTLDGRPTLIIELPANFQVRTTHALGGFVLTPTRNADGTISLSLTQP